MDLFVAASGGVARPVQGRGATVVKVSEADKLAHREWWRLPGVHP